MVTKRSRLLVLLVFILRLQQRGCTGEPTTNPPMTELRWLKQQIEQLQETISEERGQRIRLENAMANLTEQINELKLRQNKPQAAFSVGKTSRRRSIVTGMVTFDRAFVNIGNAFNMQTNTFTCPLAGTYVFYLHGENLQDYPIGIYLNNDPTARANVAYTGGSNTALLNLHASDNVTVRFSGRIPRLVVTTDVGTIFSGYLLA